MQRFVNAYIIVGKVSDYVTLNRYAYANGNPVSNVDPFGLSVERGKAYNVEYRKDINGIGITQEGIIYAGLNVKDSDIEILKKIANMTYSGYSEKEILSVISEYTKKMDGKTVIKNLKTLLIISIVICLEKNI